MRGRGRIKVRKLVTGEFVRDGEPPEEVEALAHEQERLVTGEERLSGS